MTDEKKDLTQPNSQDASADELQKKLKSQSQELEKLQASFKKMQATKDTEVAAANKRAKEEEERRKTAEAQLLESVEDPSVRANLRIQQLETQIKRQEILTLEQERLQGARTYYAKLFEVPLAELLEGTTVQEVIDLTAAYVNAQKKEVKKEPMIEEPTQASTASTTAPTATSTLTEAEVEKRKSELKAIMQDGKATKRDKRAAQQEWLRLSRPGVVKARVRV